MSSTISPKTEYLSIGANRHTAVADWSDTGVLAFGADVNVALWQPGDQSYTGIKALLGGHTAAVKAVNFVPQLGTADALYLISGGDDKAIKVWRIDSNNVQESTCVQTLEEHQAAINCIAVAKSASSTSNGTVLAATGSADATIRIWSLDTSQQPPNGPLKLIQTIKTNPKFFPLCLALSPLITDNGKGESYILAAGGTRNTIHAYIGDYPILDQSNTTDHPSPFVTSAVLSGHEGWIRSLDMSPAESSNDLLLASASQDKYVRLWRIHAGEALPPISAGAESAFAGGARSPANKVHRIQSTVAGPYSITFEALLLGHEDWIYSARWRTHQKDDSSNSGGGKLQLLSTSADNSLTIWEADPESGIWFSAARLGEISREKGATTATGSTGGFWTGLWSPDGKSVVTLGRTGGWRMWNRVPSPDSVGGLEDWEQQFTVGGHVKSVMGLAWEGKGRYLLSMSHDQTTRLHAPWTETSTETTEAATAEKVEEKGWHELARPQIHGYDLNCLSILDSTSFVSGADEKLLRVFKMPRPVSDLLSRISSFAPPSTSTPTSDAKPSPSCTLPDAANIPVLGLSNKIVVPSTDDPSSQIPDNPQPITASTALYTSHPPYEDTLSRYSLFPETEKLYGHGYELSACATTAASTPGLIASACKATSVEHATIRIFETKNWTEIGPPLKMHALTCTRLRFSPGDDMLLSVGRDRAWGVFARPRGAGQQNGIEKTKGEEQEKDEDKEEDQGKVKTGEEENNNFTLKWSNIKAHTRMILDCAWAPDSLAFVTAGRDKNVKLWVLPEQKAAAAATVAGVENSGIEKAQEKTKEGEVDNGAISAGQVVVTEDTAITAVDFLPLPSSRRVLAVGTEAGKVGIYVETSGTFVAVASKHPLLHLPKAIHQLAWRPSPSPSTTPELAVGGEDGSLRIFSFPGLLDIPDTT